MDKEKTLEDQTAPDNNGLPQDGTPSEEYLKPWMQQLGKAFAKNEQLAKYDRLADAVDDLLKRPEPKEIPSSYGLRDGTEELFRNAGLTKKEAQDIDAYYSQMSPKAKPDLKEVFKDGYEEKMGLYQNGVKSISDDLKDRISETGLDKDPVFVEIMSRVGKETGGKPFNEIRKPDNVKRKSDPAMDAVRKSYERYYGRK